MVVFIIIHFIPLHLYSYSLLGEYILKKAKTFLVNSVILILTSLVTKVICSTFDIFVANKIGAEALGVFGLISSTYFFFVTLASSGINLSTTKVMSEELELNPNADTKYILKKSLFFSGITGTFSAIVLIIFTPYVVEHFLLNKVNNLVIYVLSLSLPFIALGASLSSYFYAKRKVLSISISQVLSQLVRMILIYILLFFARNISTSILCLVTGAVASEMATFILHYFIYRKESKKEKSLTKPTNISKRILKIAIPIALTSYIRAGLNTIKHVLIPLRLKLTGMSYESALQNYGAITGMALPIIMFGSVIVYSFSSLLVPEFSRYSVIDEKGEMHKDIHKLFKFTLYFSIGLTGILMFFGNDIGKLIYNTQGIGRYIKLLAPLISLIYLDNVIDNILKGLGKQVSVMVCNIVDMVVSISFIYFLLPKFGAIGYIVVMYISEILNYTISVITLFKTANVKFKYFEWVILPTVTIIFSIVLSKLFNATILIKILISLFIYITILFFTNRKRRIVII